jgi:DNA-binding XRE family transcriptional regulator
MNNKAVEEINNNVKKYRVWKGIRQSDLAKDLKISIAYYRKIEAGYYPKYQVRSRICKYFNVNHDQMFYVSSLVGGVLNETC